MNSILQSGTPVSRKDIFCCDTSPSPSSPAPRPETDSPRHVCDKKSANETLLRSITATLPQYEIVDFLNTDKRSSAQESSTNSPQGSGEQNEQEEFEFRLFAAPAPAVTAATTFTAVSQCPLASKPSAASIQRIRIVSPPPNLNPGFVNPSRRQEYYFAGALSAGKRAEYVSAAVDGEDVRRWALCVWPGCAYAWKVIWIEAGGFGGKEGIGGVKGRVEGEAGNAGGEDVSGKMPGGLGTGIEDDVMGVAGKKKKRKKKQPGKAARIRIRVRLKKEEARKMREHEKRSRKNQAKKLRRKKKAEEKKKECVMGNVDGDVLSKQDDVGDLEHTKLVT